MTHHHFKQRARAQFDAWAHGYDRSILQRLIFQPSYDAFAELLVEWYGDSPRTVRMLDVGCGTGTLAAGVALSQLPIEVIGLDYSVAMCVKANDKARAAQVDRLAGFVAGDSEHLPFADGTFDVLTCSNSFHHYPHQQAAVAEMYRVLAPGGRLMIIDGFRDNVIGWFVFDVCVESVEQAVHHASYTRMREYFTAAGFTGIMQRKINVFCPILLTAATRPDPDGGASR